MIIWIDAQLSPGLARWIRETFGIEAQAVRDVGLRNAKDPVIFKAAREARVVVMSKDEDFRSLVERLGPPPQVLWVTCGNTSNAWLREILTKSLPVAIELLQCTQSIGLRDLELRINALESKGREGQVWCFAFHNSRYSSDVSIRSNTCRYPSIS